MIFRLYRKGIPYLLNRYSENKENLEHTFYGSFAILFYQQRQSSATTIGSIVNDDRHENNSTMMSDTDLYTRIQTKCVYFILGE